MKRAFIWLWLAAFLLALGVSPGFQSYETPDFTTVRSIVVSGQFGLDRRYNANVYQALDGRWYEVHDIGAVLFAVPIGIVAERVAAATHQPYPRVYELLLCMSGCALYATTLMLLLALLGRMGVRPEDSAAPLFVLLSTSQYFVHSVAPPDLAIATPFVVAALYAWRRAEDGMTIAWGWAGLCVGAALLIKVSLATIAVALLCRIGYVGLRSARPRHAVFADCLFGVGLLPGLLGTGWWNHVRTGSVWVGTYPAWIHGFRPTYLGFGLAEAVFSPNKGVLAYTPTLLLLAWSCRREGFLRRQPAFAFVVGASFLMTLFRLSGTIAASSSGGWGNRYYIPWMALFMIPIAADWRRIHPRAIALGLVALGGILGAAALITNWHFRQTLCGAASWQWHGTNACAVLAAPSNLARAAGANIPDVVAPNVSTADLLISNRLAFWWYAIRTAGVPDWISWTIGGTLFAGMAACLLAFRAAVTREAR